MKVKSNFVLSAIADEYVVVPVDQRAEEFKGMIRLNETGAFLWKLLEHDITEEHLMDAVLDEYDIQESDAKQYISKFLEKLSDANLME